MTSWLILVVFFIIGFILNLIFIAYFFGSTMRYIIKPLYHKSWGENHKKYRNEFNFLNLLEDGFILIYLILAIPLIFSGLMGFIFVFFSDETLIGNLFLDKIISIIGIVVLAGFGWSLIEHEEHMKERAKRKLKNSQKNKKKN